MTYQGGQSTLSLNGVVTTGSYANPSWITSLSGSIISGTITNVAYTNTANTFTAAQSVTPVAVTSVSNSIATNAALSNNFTHTLTQNTTLANPSNLVSGTIYTWEFTQGSGPYTLAFGNDFTWPGGNALVVSTVNGAVDVITGYYDGTKIRTVVSGQAFA